MKRFFAGREKKAVFVLVVLAIGLLAALGDRGLLDVYRLRDERDGILRFNASLRDENSTLERKIELLKNDDRYIGYIARKELGMIGRNEIVYRMEDD